MKFQGPASLRWSNEPWIGFHFTWDNDGPAITESLKNFPIRAWDPTNKTWWFPQSLAGLLAATVQGYFPDLRVPPVPVKVAQESRSPQKNDHFLLGLHSEAPDVVVHAAYRALARDLDPNRSVGGLSSTPFDEVTSAYQRICRARGLELIKLSVF